MRREDGNMKDRRRRSEGRWRQGREDNGGEIRPEEE